MRPPGAEAIAADLDAIFAERERVRTIVRETLALFGVRAGPIRRPFQGKRLDGREYNWDCSRCWEVLPGGRS